jgi:hypothetical protein
MVTRITTFVWDETRQSSSNRKDTVYVPDSEISVRREPEKGVSRMAALRFGRSDFDSHGRHSAVGIITITHNTIVIHSRELGEEGAVRVFDDGTSAGVRRGWEYLPWRGISTKRKPTRKKKWGTDSLPQKLGNTSSERPSRPEGPWLC